MYVATVSTDNQREPITKIFYHLRGAWSWCAIQIGEDAGDPETFGEKFLDSEWYDEDKYRGCGTTTRTGFNGWSASVDLLTDDSKCPTCGHQLHAEDAL